ncbi:MAG: hypothetical protein U0325_20455 [Polyangiales bacterium]
MNLFTDRNGIGSVMRRILYEILPRPRSSGCSSSMLEFCELTKGLVLRPGPRVGQAPPSPRSSTG